MNAIFKYLHNTLDKGCAHFLQQKASALPLLGAVLCLTGQVLFHDEATVSTFLFKGRSAHLPRIALKMAEYSHREEIHSALLRAWMSSPLHHSSLLAYSSTETLRVPLETRCLRIRGDDWCDRTTRIR